jgi:disulfide bond formation protein DsbB
MTWLRKNSLYIAWAAALIAMLGSLYFSNIRGFPPCVLCWYQRICIYPLVIIIGIGILRRDAKMYLYALPLAIIGGVIAIYHNLLYYQILPESAAPCTAGISCTTKFIEYFGFMTIPFLSLLAFIIITACLLIYRSSQERTA